MIADWHEDTERQKSGAPIYINTDLGVITFYVKRLGTFDSEKQLKIIRAKLFGPFHKSTDVDNNAVYAHWLSEYGVSGWDDETGQLGKYTPENARKTFTDEGYFLSLNRQLINDALIFEHFLSEQTEEVIESLKKP